MRDKAPIKIADDARMRAISSIRRYFSEELDQDIGDLKAGLVFDYFVTEHGPTIYNQGIADAQAFFEDRIADLGALSHQIEFPFWNSSPRGGTNRSKREGAR